MAQTKTENSLNENMVEIGNVMTKLFPLIFSDQPLSEQQNKNIYRSVGEMQALFKKAGPDILKKSPTYQMSYQLLQDYLDAILVENNPATLPEIKDRLSTLSHFCVSCHTQDSEFRTLFSGIQDAIFESDLARADFNYATRNYREAHEYYEKYLISNADLKDSVILKTLFRILSIYTQVLNNPEDAIDALNRLVKRRTFSADIAKYIRESKDALTDLHASISRENQTGSFKELSFYVTQYIGSSNMGSGIVFSTSSEKIQRTWLRGLLFRYLNNTPKPDEMPYILYWLALCDLSLGYDYSLADFYVKQCITRFPDHPFAQHCFSEYKKHVKFYYTTPTEPILPFEINDELNKLESYLKKK